MKRALVVFVSLFIVGTALADPTDLEGGVFIAHYPTELQFSSPAPPEGWCEHYLDRHAIDCCEVSLVKTSSAPVSDRLPASFSYGCHQNHGRAASCIGSE